MKVEYDVTTDSMYISLNEGVSAESEEVTDGVVLDFDDAGKVVGIDIQHHCCPINFYENSRVV